MRSNKKGFTIVEIVIALTIISIVSLTATSLVLLGQRISKSTRDNFFAVNLCNNSIVIFQASAMDENSKDLNGLYTNFKQYLADTLELKLPDNLDDNQLKIYFDSNWTQISGNTNEAKIECWFLFQNKENKFITLDITITAENSELYSATYSMPLVEAQ